MYGIFKRMALSTVVISVMTCAPILNAQSTSDSSLRISKLAGYSGEGFCSVEQSGQQVKATVKVINLTPGSTATAWLKFDGSTVGRLDGTIADYSGEAVFSRTFSAGAGVSSFLFDVRDHNRQLSSVTDNGELTAELTQPKNLITGESIRMGTCSFDNLYNSLLAINKNIYLDESELSAAMQNSNVLHDLFQNHSAIKLELYNSFWVGNVYLPDNVYENNRFTLKRTSTYGVTLHVNGTQNYLPYGQELTYVFTDGVWLRE